MCFVLGLSIRSAIVRPLTPDDATVQGMAGLASRTTLASASISARERHNFSLALRERVGVREAARSRCSWRRLGMREATPRFVGTIRGARAMASLHIVVSDPLFIAILRCLFRRIFVKTNSGNQHERHL